MRMRNFNSTIVRLKDVFRHVVNAVLVNFNSTIVRLKDNRHWGRAEAKRLFQFYNSSIKSRSKPRRLLRF